MEAIINIAIFLALITLGFTTGSIIEKSHLKRLDNQEQLLGGMLKGNLKQIPTGVAADQVFMVCGSVCIATDYFKVFIAGLVNLFGGELKTYNTLMVRARREAVVRMLIEAQAAGAESVWNIRYETMTIQGKKKPGGIEVLAYATAVKAA